MKSNLDDKRLLTHAPIGRLFLTYAIPSVITMVFYGFQSLVDGVIVSNHLGAEAVGGVSIIMPFYSAIMVISLIVGVGTQALIGNLLGKKNNEEAQNVMTTGFWALLVIGILVTVCSYLFAEDFTRLLGADEVLLPYALGYMKGLLPFVVPITLAFYCDAMLKATGHPKVSSLIMSSAVVLNLLLSLFFIVVLEWGITGASVATGLAFTIALLVSATITFRSKSSMSMLKGTFQFSMLRQAFYNGSSEGVSELASAMTILIMNLAIMDMVGAAGVAALSAINYVNFTGVLLFLGISDGLIPVLSYNYGAKQFKRVRRLYRFALTVNIVVGLVVFTFLQFFGDLAVGIFFDSSNSEVFDIALQGLSIYSFVFLMNGFNILTTSFFTALGQAKSSIIIAGLRGLVFVVGGVALLPSFFGMDGIWATIPVAEFLTLFVAVFLVVGANRKILY
ncbi:MATE family efflux transporter [Pontibacter sp. 13R65]|uniref:MATE family efflux transporter n=1 Tax=Pontibacter sp. 13R65 TaxID=3127458 RepID=UPI00301D6D6E